MGGSEAELEQAVDRHVDKIFWAADVAAGGGVGGELDSVLL